MRRNLQILVLTLATFVALFHSCGTKVDNPDNDDEQEEVDPIVFAPIEIQFLKFPDVSAADADDSIKQLFTDTFALMQSTNVLLGQLNEFFQLVNDHQLTRSGPIRLEKDGIVLEGRSWFDAERNGLYFCNGGTKTFYITWDADDLHIWRNFAGAAPISAHPMTDGLAAVIEAKIDIAADSIDVAYSGLKRDPTTVKDTDENILFQYYAKRSSEQKTEYSGEYAPTDAAFTVPERVERRVVGDLDAESNGRLLAHIDLLCPDFDETNPAAPGWCILARFGEGLLVLDDSGVPAATAELAHLPLPRRDALKKVDFPQDMQCPPPD